MITYRLTLKGKVPPKKNLLRRGKKGRMFYDEDVKAAIDALITQVQGQWKREPIKFVEYLQVTFYVNDVRRDGDNCFATVSDSLVKGHALVNDNMAHVPRFGVEAIVDSGEERTEIEITVQQGSLL